MTSPPSIAVLGVLAMGQIACPGQTASADAPGGETQATGPLARPDGDKPSALPLGVIVVTPEGGEALRLQVELALDDASRMRGLMFRETLEAGHGMLFLFDKDRVQAFWMKNTMIPLDMIFIDRAGVVAGVVHEAAPLTTTSRRVKKASRSVLEVPGGWAARHGVREGAKVSAESLPPGVSFPD